MIALTFSENLDHPTYTTTIRSAFTVTVDGTDATVNGTSGGMDKVNLSVSNAIAEGQTVVVSYDQSDAGTEARGTPTATRSPTSPPAGTGFRRSSTTPSWTSARPSSPARR